LDLAVENGDIFPASPPTSQEVGKDKLRIKAIENGDIQNICRGFQPLEITFYAFPTIGIVGYKYIVGFTD